MNEMNGWVAEIEETDSKGYWLRKLDLPTPPSGIKPDYIRPDDNSFEKGYGKVSLSPETFEKLMRLTATSNFLLYVALLTALKICLHKFTGDNTVIAGSPSRLRAEATGRANALPIITEIDDRLSFRELLLQVRETLLEVYGKHDYPYKLLVHHLDLHKIRHPRPLFDVALALTDIHTPLLQVENNITLTFTLEDRSLSGSIEFNSRLLEKQSVDQFVSHFLHLLDESLDNTSLPVSQLNLLTPLTQELILNDWNNTKVDCRDDYHIHELIEEESLRRPMAIALDCGEEKITYFELNGRTNRLARYLMNKGVGLETLVGVCLERGLEMVVAILGVLKAGGAYVPLDATYPEQRLAYLMENASLGLVITQRRFGEKLPQRGSEMLYLDQQWGEISEFSEESVRSGVWPDNLAYVIYTSGTTGNPKGVMITHRGLHNLVEGQIRGFKIAPDNRVLQFASMSFDASVSEIFVSLAAGACLFIPNKDKLLPGGELEGEIREKQITTATLPPSVLRLMSRDRLECFKTVIAAGEACGHDILETWAPDRLVINAYGPTEATVCATMGERRSGEARVSIGGPIQNTKAYVLDHRQSLTSIDVVGELYISGVGVARGYLRDQVRTSETFLPDAYSEEMGARMYRTGDLCRYGANGRIGYIGRRDRQIKIRGYRVEPAEIEEVLNEQEEIKESAVVVKRSKDGEQRLVAYIAPDRGDDSGDGASVLGVDDVRSILKKRLPAYMLPSEIVMLKTLPLTANGKLDRSALAARVDEHEARDSSQEPRTETEHLIAEIWRNLLGIEAVGRNDNFFELGGHSLMAIRLISSLREVFKIEVPLRSIFESPTVANMSAIVSGFRTEAENTAEELTPIIHRVTEDVNQLFDEIARLSEDEARIMLSNRDYFTNPV